MRGPDLDGRDGKLWVVFSEEFRFQVQGKRHNAANGDDEICQRFCSSQVAGCIITKLHTTKLSFP